MKFIHFAVACRSEAESDRFYQEVLGLKKIKSSQLPGEIIGKIFGDYQDRHAIAYRNDHIVAEIFISDLTENPPRTNFNHICVGVKDRDAFIKKCQSYGIEPIKVQKGDSTIIFIKDFSSNLFEIKEQE